MKRCLKLMLLVLCFTVSEGFSSDASFDSDLKTEIGKARAATYLMFQGDAKSAIALYSSVFDDFKILKMVEYEKDAGSTCGKIKIATANFAGQSLFIADSPISHEWSFTPAVSLFVNFTSLGELETAFNTLSDKGKIFMPLDNYGFSEKFGWVADPYGVTWQLNLPATS